VNVTQKFDDSPDAYVGGPGLAGAKQITNTNPFLTSYAWGRSEVFEFKSEKGVRLQGSLHYPAGYEPGKKYPMVVYLYEKLSDGRVVVVTLGRRHESVDTDTPWKIRSGEPAA
jgi:predicted peptidase